MIARNCPTPMAKMPIQSRSCGVSPDADTAGAAVVGDLSAVTGLRRASAIPARPLRRNTSARLIVDFQCTKNGRHRDGYHSRIPHLGGVGCKQKEPHWSKRRI